MKRIITLLVLLSAFILIAGDLTGGLDKDSLGDKQYKVEVKRTLPPYQLKMLDNFISSIDSMECDSLFILGDRLLKKQQSAYNDKTSNLYNVLLEMVVKKARDRSCVRNEQVQEPQAE